MRTDRDSPFHECPDASTQVRLNWPTAHPLYEPTGMQQQQRISPEGVATTGSRTKVQEVSRGAEDVQQIDEFAEDGAKLGISRNFNSRLRSWASGLRFLAREGCHCGDTRPIEGRPPQLLRANSPRPSSEKDGVS